MIVKMALIRLTEKWIMYTERNTQEVRDYPHYFKFIISVIFFIPHIIKYVIYL